MTAQTIKSRVTRYGEVEEVLRFQNVAALTATADICRWGITCFARIVEVTAEAGTAGTGGTSNILDIHLNGTTIYTTQGNRPTLLTGDTGWFSLSGLGATNSPPEVVTLVPGDILTLDVDQVSTTGCALFSIAITLVKR